MLPSSNLSLSTFLLVSIAKLMTRIRDELGNMHYSCLLVFLWEIGGFFTHLALLFGVQNSLWSVLCDALYIHSAMQTLG